MESRNWTAYNIAQSEEKHRFVELLADLCSTVPQPVQQGKGRPRLPLSDMLFASVYKVYVGFSARRVTSELHNAYTAGLIDSRLHFNSVNRYIADPQLTDILKELITASSLPLKAIETDFAVDSSGFSTCRYVRWFNRKYGREIDNREWVKVHLMCGVNTKVVTADAYPPTHRMRSVVGNTAEYCPASPTARAPCRSRSPVPRRLPRSGNLQATDRSRVAP